MSQHQTAEVNACLTPNSPATAEFSNGFLEDTTAGNTSAPISLEIFAGAARLSRHLQQAGFRALAIDGFHARQPVEHSTVYMNLCDSGAQSQLVDLVSNTSVAFVHISPPGDTATRAREKVLPGRAPEDSPCPLRSETFPRGLPSLSEADSSRVEKANSLFDLTVKLLRLCLLRGVPFVCESRERSLMWFYPGFSNLRQFCDFVRMDLCEHGGDRPIGVAMLTNLPGAQRLSRRCSGQHSHAPWHHDKNVGLSLIHI
eukprot:2861457-Amphidinium_carterae.3